MKPFLLVLLAIVPSYLSISYVFAMEEMESQMTLQSPTSSNVIGYGVLTGWSCLLTKWLIQWNGLLDLSIYTQYMNNISLACQTNNSIPQENMEDFQTTFTRVDVNNQFISWSYPWCDTPDIVLWNGQVWAACNVGSTISGTGVESYGSYFQWGYNTDIIQENIVGTQWGSLDEIIDSNSGILQWPCATWYHIPTFSDMKNLRSLKDEYLVLESTIPSGWVKNSLWETVQSGSGIYWTSTYAFLRENWPLAKAVDLKSEYIDRFYIQMQDTKLPIRCIKN